MSDEFALCAEELSYAYQTRLEKVAAAVSLSCRLESGKVTAILGPSGSGKSTLGLLLAGLLKPDSGKVSFTNEDKPSPETVAYLFQFPEQLFSEDTIEKELCQGGRLSLDMAKRALQSVNLEPEGFLHRNPFEISGGQARLVAMAVQLARPFRAIIFDEPTAGLDWTMRARVRRLIREQAESDRIVGLITHNLTFASSVSESAVVLNNGHVAWEGDPKQLLDNAELRSGLGL
jgi:energy-coupling factor transport system ATP-binding protein